MWGRWKRQGSALRHLLLAGGSVAQWQAFTQEQWDERLENLLEVASRAGATYVTVHPHEIPDAGTSTHDHRIGVAASPLARRELTRGGVHVVVDPGVDGRERIRDVVASWPTHRSMTEKKLGNALFGPAGEPDLVVILGSPDRLPMSLVWELAYGELVFVDTAWSDLGADHLHRTVEEFARRQRRFGGVE